MEVKPSSAGNITLKMLQDCYVKEKQMSNHTIRNISRPVITTDFDFQPMRSDFRPRQCKHVGCTNPATQVRMKKDVWAVPDKSSKTFVCEDHLLTMEF